MKRTMMLMVLLVTIMVWGTGPAFAEAVEVEGGKIFIADGIVRVLNLSDGEPAECFSAAFAGIENAISVEVEGDKAVVTVDTGEGIDVVIVDLSTCLPDQDEPADEPVDISECVSTIDLDKGTIEIPCVYLNDVVYKLKMEQRGNSSNWQVSFADENADMLNYRHQGGDSPE